MNNDLEHTPLIDIINEMDQLQTKIDLLIMKYELLRAEVTRRFPPFEQNMDTYEKGKPKVK